MFYFFRPSDGTMVYSSPQWRHRDWIVIGFLMVSVEIMVASGERPPLTYMASVDAVVVVVFLVLL